MTREETIGNGELARALEKMARSGKIPHAMMFFENDGCGAFALVQAFLYELYGRDHKVTALIHPDIHYIYPVTGGTSSSRELPKVTSETYAGSFRELASRNPYFTEDDFNLSLGFEKKSAAISVGEARAILGKLSLTPVEGGWNTVVIFLPEKMNAAAANTLLKIVEEPSDRILFLMITHASEKVLPTITSRCQGLRVLPCTREEIEKILAGRFGKTEEEARQAALVADGSVGAALRFLSGKEDYREQMGIFTDLMHALVSKDLCGALSCGEALAALSSREKQKAFCKFAGDNLRKIFLVQQGLPGISGISSEEEPFYASMASKCRKSFPRSAMTVLDRTQRLIDRNVNQKILFCDMVDRMYSSV